MFRTYDYFKRVWNEIDARFEITLSNIIWEDMQYIPDYFEQVLKLYRDAYDENSEYHQKIFEHLAKDLVILFLHLLNLLNFWKIKLIQFNSLVYYRSCEKNFIYKNRTKCWWNKEFTKW